jgi:hypothetical protein
MVLTLISDISVVVFWAKLKNSDKVLSLSFTLTLTPCDFKFVKKLLISSTLVLLDEPAVCLTWVFLVFKLS